MADDDADDRRKREREKRDGFSWWDLPDLIEVCVWILRGIWMIVSRIARVIRD